MVKLDRDVGWIVAPKTPDHVQRRNKLHTLAGLPWWSLAIVLCQFRGNPVYRIGAFVLHCRVPGFPPHSGQANICAPCCSLRKLCGAVRKLPMRARRQTSFQCWWIKLQRLKAGLGLAGPRRHRSPGAGGLRLVGGKEFAFAWAPFSGCRTKSLHLGISPHFLLEYV